MRVKRQLLSLVLSLGLVFSAVPYTVFAGDGAGETPVCTCETACTADAMNADCPVCGAGGALPENCGQYQAQEPTAVEQVQALIDALPTVEELKAMDTEEQSAVYTDLQAAYDAYETLTDDEKQKVTGAETFDALFGVFNGMTNALADSGFVVEGGTLNTDYTLSDNTLTIKTSEPLTISGGTKDNPITGQIVIQSGTSANLTLAGVHIQGTEYTTAVAAKSAIELSSSSTLTLTLADSSNNTLKGGSGNNSSGTNGPAAPGIHVPDGTTLTVLCGAADSTGDHICNSSSNNCGKLAITGGGSDSGAGGVGIGGGAPVSGNTPGNFTGQPCGTVLLLGGGISVTGGTGSGSVQAMDIGGSRGEGSGSGGAGGTVIILTNVTSTSGSLNIGGGSSTNPSVTPNNGAGIKPGTDPNTYEVYGSLELPADLTIPAGVTVNIPQNTALTVPNNTTLTNNGTITGDGTLTLNGNANGNGSVSVNGFTKKDQTNVPSAPSSTSAVTAASVTLNAVTDSGGVNGIQYGYTTGAETSVPDNRWQASTTFNNLAPGTTYIFYARYAGNGFYNPSAASSSGLTVTTYALVDAETPNITTHPQGGTYTVGADTTLSVAASVNDGGTLSYQWYSNTTDSNTGGTAISGATSSSYNPPTSAAGTTYYYCVVTNTNSSATGTKTATAASNVAAVTVEKKAPTDETSSSGSTPTYTRKTLTGEHGVSLTGSRVHQNARLTVKAGELHPQGSCAACDALRALEEHILALYELSLSRDFKGSVQLTFTVPEAYAGKTLTVAHCGGGTLERWDVPVSNGKVEVTVDSLGLFAVLDGVYDLSAAAPDSPGESETPETPVSPESPTSPENPVTPGTESPGPGESGSPSPDESTWDRPSGESGSASKTDGAVPTGDQSGLGLWLTLGLAALAGILIGVRRRRS